MIPRVFQYLGIFVFIVVFFAGCATAPSREPWVENGVAIGQIIKYNSPYGKEYRYLDTQGVHHKTELRNNAGALLPGPSVMKYRYDGQRRLTEERFFDASETPIACKDGYAVRILSYSLDSSGNGVVEHSLQDHKGKAICSTRGYAFVRLVFSMEGNKVEEVFLEDENKQPASGQWDGISGVARVKYVTLEGVGPVRCGVYFGPSGAVVERKQLEGSTSAYSTYQTYTYYNYGYYNNPHRGTHR